MSLAARVSDMHTCPMVTGLVPHVGGPILPPCEPTVLIDYLPAARQGDMATCVGPPDTIAMGSPSVLIGHKPAARMGDPTTHGGVVVAGCATVIIGVVGMGAPMVAGASSGATKVPVNKPGETPATAAATDQGSAFQDAAASGSTHAPSTGSGKP